MDIAICLVVSHVSQESADLHETN